MDYKKKHWLSPSKIWNEVTEPNSNSGEFNRCQEVINAFMHQRETIRKNKLINFNIVADIPLAYRVCEAEVKHSGNGPK